MYGPSRPSPDGSPDELHGRAPAPPRAQLRLSDAAIAAIAEQIVQAMPLRAPDDRTTWVLSRRAELPDEDEGRVIRLLTERHRAVQPGQRP